MNYSKTVHLPKTTFPMKADLPKREPHLLDFWNQNGIYEKMVEKRRGKKKYILHDGPPYANGHIHMGHALNKILKDMIVKYHAVTGNFSPYVPGWDCHGLPIEHQLMKDLKKDKHTVDRSEFRKKAAEFAKKFVQIQKEEFKRLGIFSDWENPYLTLSPKYETVILRVFRELLLKGYIYRSQKPVLWCSRCETALAEAEVEYEEKESPAITVKLPVRAGASGKKPLPSDRLFILIWTTTPWTLPANVGFMLHPSLEYAVVHIKSKNEDWIIAKNRLKDLLEDQLQLSGQDYEIKEVQKGDYFSNWNCSRIFPEAGEKIELSQGFASQSVSAEDGTGIVHIAPGHGDVDYTEGHLNHGLPVISPVDDTGKFTETAGDPSLKGLFVLKKGNARVLEILKDKDLLAHHSVIRHSYPHCWRCKSPVIFRATYQWFLKVDHLQLRDTMLSKMDQVRWIPSYGKGRIGGMVEQRPDWCLSRQRLWGTPIPVFYCEDCRAPLLDDQAVGMVEEIIGLEGSDVWFKEEAEYFLKNPAPFKCGNCGKGKFVKEDDILDVWFDSGVSHEAVLKGETRTVSGREWNEDLRWPADLYLEGSDQHRGWFQSSLIPSVALHGRAPYEGVLTHGFVVDGTGKKMSKSLGNVIAPEDILKDYGADILRLWVASSDYREDIRLSKDILKGVAENYRKIRNTFRYLIGNLSDFDLQSDSLPYDRLLESERWILSRLFKTVAACRRAYESCEFHRVVVSLIEFCVIDCSSFYFDILKDRLYTFKKSSPERQSAQMALHHILYSLLKLFSPILSFTCEEVWQLGTEKKHWEEISVFLDDFPELPEEWKNEELEKKWGQILRIREKANLSLESARQKGLIGSSLEAAVTFSGGDKEESEVLKEFGTQLAPILIVSQVEMKNGKDSLEIHVRKAAGLKCSRCWRYDETVSRDSSHPEICSRCVEMIQ